MVPFKRRINKNAKKFYVRRVMQGSFSLYINNLLTVNQEDAFKRCDVTLRKTFIGNKPLRNFAFRSN